MNCDFYLTLKHKKAFVYFNITVKVSESILIRTAVPCVCDQLLLEPELTLPKVALLASRGLPAAAEVKILAQEAVDEVVSCIACNRQNGGERITAYDLVGAPR